MSKITELFDMQSKANQLSSQMIEMLQSLNASTEKYIFSISIEKGLQLIIRNKKLDHTLILDRDEMNALYEFLKNLTDEQPKEPKSLSKDKVKMS